MTGGILLYVPTVMVKEQLMDNSDDKYHLDLSIGSIKLILGIIEDHLMAYGPLDKLSPESQDEFAMSM